MSIYKLLVGNNYIPRRNYRYSTSQKDNTLISSFFRNAFLRKLIYFLNNKIIKKHRFKNSINNRLFEYQPAPKLEINGSMIDFKKEYLLIDFSRETKKSIVIKPNKSISAKLSLNKKSYFFFSLAILENLELFDVNLLKNDLMLNIDLFNKNGEKLKNFFFQLPMKDKKHGIMRQSKDKNWIEMCADLKNYQGQIVELQISASFTSKNYTLFNRTIDYKQNKLNKKISIPCIAIGNPKLVEEKENTKKILFISGESLTDPFYLKKKYGDLINMPNIEMLEKESLRYEKSYSIGDSTLPTIMSYKSGLFPSQHGFGDYSLPTFEINQSENNQTLPRLLNQEGFVTKSITSYPRFDSLYGWSYDFDSYYQSEYPFFADAPDASRIIRSFEMDRKNDLYLFTHLTRLHGPLLSGDDSQTPNRIKIEDLDHAMKDNFMPLFSHQLGVFDDQIGQIIDYLKRTDQYEDTLIILVGDHGVSLPPKWNFKGNIFAHYEDHARVPLIVKPASWSKINIGIENKPVTAQKEIFDFISKALNLETPQNYSNLPQYEDEFKDLAISETIYHPKKDNYAIMMVSREYKYWMIAKVDWIKYEITSLIDEKIFKINNDGIADEENNLIGEKEIEATLLNFRYKSKKFFNKSSNFRKKYPLQMFPSTINL